MISQEQKGSFHRFILQEKGSFHWFVLQEMKMLLTLEHDLYALHYITNGGFPKKMKVFL